VAGGGAEGVGLLLFTVGLAFAVPLAVAEGQDTESTVLLRSRARYVGELGSVARIALSAFAELYFLAHACISEFRSPD